MGAAVRVGIKNDTLFLLVCVGGAYSNGMTVRVQSGEEEASTLKM